MASLASMPGPRRWLLALTLALGPVVTLAQKSAADYYVKNLPGLPPDQTPINMHAGHIEITPETNGNLFFWHFQNRHIANRQRTVIWVNGGPGCSSEDGALMEIGPYRVKDKSTLVSNNGSWNEFANLLFVDNPVGTGFSYANTNSYLHELGEMGDQANDCQIYIAGESYAGQFIPYIAKSIIERNNRSSDRWNLSGLLLGNPWLDPGIQYDAYLKFALQKGLIDKNADGVQTIRDAENVCHQTMKNNPGKVTYGTCESVLNKFLLATRKENGGDQACINMYDIRLRDSYPSCGMNWPPDLAHVTPYLGRDEVRKALHVNQERAAGWQECNSGVSSAFQPQNSKPSAEILPEILSQVSVLIYSGAEDLICNHLGTETIIDGMQWNGGTGFETSPGTRAPRRNWTFEGDGAGFWQSARNLTYVVFYNASHMVPFDFPRRTRDMLDRFMGVDIRSIGGDPTDSRIDGEKGLETTVGGSVNPKESEAAVKQRLKEAKWAAYRRSGEVVLAVVILGALGFVFFVWRQRRRVAAYSALRSEELDRRAGVGGDEDGIDLEAQEEGIALQSHILPVDKYAVGDDSDDEGEGGEGESTMSAGEGGRKGKQPSRMDSPYEDIRDENS